MIDTTQILLVTVILVLTVMLTVIGIQVVYILREFRNTVHKINKVLDDTGVISESVSKPVSALSGMMLGIKTGTGIMKMFSRSREEKE